MVPDIDPPPDYGLIADRKGKRATDDEKIEIYRLKEAGMPLQQLIEITNRSEDSIRRYIREVDGAMDAAVRTRAEAYEHMVNPQAPPAAAPQRPPPEYYDDDDDDYEAPPSARRPGPPPPPEAPVIELDLDDLFEEDELVDPTEEDALAKKLYVFLIQKNAFKGADAEELARDVAQTFRMYPDYHNPHGLVEFLKAHEVKERKANIISRLLFGWQQQQQGQVPFNPGPVPGWNPGMQPPPPGSPGFNQFQQPWGGGYTGYGVPGHQPTMPGQYPYPWPQPPMPTMPQGKQISKDDVVKAVQDAIQKNNEEWQRRWEADNAKREKDDEKRVHKEEMDELRAANQRLEAQLTEIRMNPQVAPPAGDYEAVETPVHDEEGNVIQVRTQFVRREDPQIAKLQQDYKEMKEDAKEERKQLSETLKSLNDALSKAQTETVKAQLEGQIDVIKAKSEAFDATQEKLDKMNDELWKREKEKMKLEYENKDGLSEPMQIANMQKDMFTTMLGQFRLARQDVTKTLLIISGKGRPEGVVEEQWTDEELSQL